MTERKNKWNSTLRVNVKHDEGKEIILNREWLLQELHFASGIDKVEELRKFIESLEIKIKENSLEAYTSNASLQGTEPLSRERIIEDLEQVARSYTLERMRYYLKRQIKSLTEIKKGRINDINLNRWKDYNDIITDSLWLFKNRDSSGEHLGWYWGNFIPQIPYQLLIRYTRRDEWVLDPFAGSGTTMIECRRLGRNCIGIDLNEGVIEKAKERINREENKYNIITDIIQGDSGKLDFRSLLAKYGIKSVQMIILHPPYNDIIKFSENSNDLSNATSVGDFIYRLEKIVRKCSDVLDKRRYMALVIGDQYKEGHWVPLGFLSMEMILRNGFGLKSIIVKNFDETRGKRSKSELWRYRALQGEYYVFKHEYIFLFIKEKEITSSQ